MLANGVDALECPAFRSVAVALSLETAIGTGADTAVLIADWWAASRTVGSGAGSTPSADCGDSPGL